MAERTTTLLTPAQLVQAAIVSVEAKAALMLIGGSEAMKAMLYMQEIIDHNTLANLDDRHIIRRLLVQLSRKSGILPSSLFLTGIQRRSEDSMAGGSFADIFIAEYRGQKVALKRLRSFHPDPERKAAQFDAFCREALIWHQLQHPNILPFLGVDVKTFESAQLPCMVSPWMENGSITQCMVQLGQAMDQDLVDKWILQTAKGLCYLHDERVVHGDLRGANILVDEHLSIQLSDFGLAKFADASTASWGTSSAGSIRWTAPEVLHSGRASFESDIYSFGCVCLEIYTRKYPFPSLVNDAQVVAHILKGTPPDMHHTPSSSTERLLDMMRLCWRRDVSARPTASWIIEGFSLGWSSSALDDLLWRQADRRSFNHDARVVTSPTSNWVVSSPTSGWGSPPSSPSSTPGWVSTSSPRGSPTSDWRLSSAGRGVISSPTIFGGINEADTPAPPIPAWRNVQPRRLRRRKDVDAAPPPPAPSMSNVYPRTAHPIPIPSNSWKDWQPDPTRRPSPPIDAEQLLIPRPASAGLFGPRSPRHSRPPSPIDEFPMASRRS